MKKHILLKIVIAILLLSLPSSLFSQEKLISGVILDSLKNPIQYANIGVLNKPIGTVSNQKGEFILSLDNSHLSDTLKISSLGYASKELLIKDLFNKSKSTITLDNLIEELNEVVVYSNNLKPHSKGREKTKTNQELFFVVPDMSNVNLGAEIGRKFSIGKEPSNLTEFKFYLKQNNFDKVRFRINIYSIKKNIPQKRLNEKDIFSDIQKDYTGWVSVDLSKYDITVNQDIIITIEWIEASKMGDTLSLPIFAPSLSAIHYYKQSAQSKWRKYRLISTTMLLNYKQ